jgi:hypothetical protein
LHYLYFVIRKEVLAWCCTNLCRFIIWKSIWNKCQKCIFEEIYGVELEEEVLWSLTFRKCLRGILLFIFIAFFFLIEI